MIKQTKLSRTDQLVFDTVARYISKNHKTHRGEIVSVQRLVGEHAIVDYGSLDWITLSQDESAVLVLNPVDPVGGGRFQLLISMNENDIIARITGYKGNTIYKNKAALTNWNEMRRIIG